MKEGTRIGCTNGEFTKINKALNANGLMAQIHRVQGEMLIFTIVKLEKAKEEKCTGKSQNT